MRIRYDRDSSDSAIRQWERLSKELSSFASKQWLEWMEQAISLAETAVARNPFLGATRVCNFPKEEPCCDDSCCLLRFLHPGETAREPIRLRNAGKRNVTFKFTTTKMEAVDGLKAPAPVVKPKSLTLEPGKSGTVRIEYHTKEMKPGCRYEGEIKVTGFCEQVIRLAVDVASEDDVSCTLEQKDCSPRYRLDWRRHFYCEPPERRG